MHRAPSTLTRLRSRAADVIGTEGFLAVALCGVILAIGAASVHAWGLL
ncbi:MAG: hypothetical protein JNM77_08720 [Pseudonocardia sp.]|nr:hypothetical protein [Pseudonocardia sp.]